MQTSKYRYIKGELYQPKMIITDLDSTLLRTDKSITDYAVNIINECRKKGIKIVFATARSEKASELFTSVIKPDGIVSNGGALARYDDILLYHSVITPDTVAQIIEQSIKTPCVGYITVDTEEGYFVNHPIDLNDLGWQSYRHAIQYDFTKRLECDVNKMAIEFEDRNIAYKIADEFPEVDIIEFSGENWYRFANRDATKWKGVEAILSYLNISADDIIVFGDDYSDIEMIKYGGAGVAVANAIDEVKAVADYECDSCDDDGVAKWIADNVL